MVMKMKMKGRHPWLVARQMETAFVVLRIDHFNLEPEQRGHIASGNSPKRTEGFHDTTAELARLGKMYARNGGFNLWKTADEAIKAAEWATNKYGNVYGVFEMCYIVEPLNNANVTPIKRG